MTVDGATPLVSIVIPVCNQADLTLRVLVSVVETVSDLPYEVVLVDDGSTDHTDQVLAALSGDVTILRNATSRGFGQACNQGAAAAKGRYLLFLRADTTCRPGWLPPLVAALDDHPRWGAVQPRLLADDGRLTDAGGLVFADGVVAAYGAGSRYPDAPMFLHRRPVDAVSTACVLVRVDALRDAGGFDPDFTSARYLGADLSFALAARGWTVGYEPGSTVVDRGTGAPATEVLGGSDGRQPERTVFAGKWAGAVAGRPSYDPAAVEAWANRPRPDEDPTAASARTVLVVSPVVPMPDGSGMSLRQAHIVQELCRDGQRVVYYCDGATHERARYAAALGALGVPLFGVGAADVPTGEQTRAELVATYQPPLDLLLTSRSVDQVLFDAWRTAELYLPTVRAHAPHAQVVLDAGAAHDRDPDPSSPRPGEVSRTRDRELAVYRGVDHLLCAQAEAEALARAGVTAAVTVVPDGPADDPSTAGAVVAALRSVIAAAPAPVDRLAGPSASRSSGPIQVVRNRARGVLCVAGMHRSGTSLTASWLERCGLTIADGNLVGPAVGNEYGHFEDHDFVSINAAAIDAVEPGRDGWRAISDRTFRIDGANRLRADELVRRRRERYDVWGWKDPRSVLLLDSWYDIVPEMRTLLLWRPCAQVVDSLVRRAERASSEDMQIDAVDATRVWLAYNARIVAYRIVHPETSVLLPVSEVVTHDEQALGLLVDRLGVPLIYRPLDGVLVDGALHGSTDATYLVPAALRQRVDEVESALRQLSALGDGRATADRITA